MLSYPSAMLVRVVFLLLASVGVRAAELPPFEAGPFPVATTNLEVRPQADAKAMFDYMNGAKSSGGAKYLTDILVHPAAVPTVQLAVPDDAQHFGELAGKRLPLVLLVVYPTTRDNPRPDYVFPYTETGDRTFSHMQRPGEAPLLADPTVKYPLVVLSGGYNTHGLWRLFHLRQLAAHGYIAVDIFQADGRNGSFATNLALRTLGVRAAIDFVLRDPGFGPAVDATRIGVVGDSAGAHTVLSLLGGTDPSGRVPAAPDPRVKVAVGVVPFMGGEFGFWPFKVDAWHFGSDHAGLRGVQRPFLALYGGKDSNVLPGGVESGVRALGGPVLAVRLDDEAHLLSDTAHRDVRTWELLFLDAWLRDDAEARRKLAECDSVAGGTRDRVTYRSKLAETRR